MKKLLIKFKYPLIILATIIIAIVSIIYYYRYQITHAVGNSQENQMFEIISNTGVMEIAQNLKDKNLIRSPWVFTVYVEGADLSLKPGIYYLKNSMTIPEITKPLSEGDIQEYKITIIEGWRIEEIAEYLEKNNIVSEAAFLKVAKNKEGYLFPDTYRISVDTKAEEIVKKMIDNYEKKTEDLDVSQDNLILASIIEREANNDEQRYNISGVFHNRLNIGMKLESCPTVSYAKGTWSAPTAADLEFIDSPYNTYMYEGLPPAPISNPGLASIKAALNPKEHDYYYFLHAKTGEMIMSKTLDEHNTNKAKYL